MERGSGKLQERWHHGNHIEGRGCSVVPKDIQYLGEKVVYLTLLFRQSLYVLKVEQGVVLQFQLFHIHTSYYLERQRAIMGLLFAAVLASTALFVVAQKGYDDSLPSVAELDVESSISVDALSAKALELQEAAYSTPNRNRVMSSEGHNNTIEWLKSYLESMSDYYTYEIQPFEALYSQGNATLTVDGEDQGPEIFEYAPGGSIEADIVPVANLGCEASDYPEEVADAIALISRGECEFGLKSALAGAAGAAGAIIYNNVPGPTGSGTLGPPPREEGEYVPTVGIAQENGTAILQLLEGGEVVTGVLEVVSDIRNVTT